MARKAEGDAGNAEKWRSFAMCEDVRLAEIALLAIIDDILQFQSQYIQLQISGLALVRVTKVPVQAPERKVSQVSKQSFSPQLSPYLIFSGAYPPCSHTVPLAFCAPSWLVLYSRTTYTAVSI